jgi:catechol 2,3-dioxygenase-like lactoylglutathione lyase family enzyme
MPFVVLVMNDRDTTPSRISQLQLVMVPSTDQDRSVAFYESLGFTRRNDIPWGDGYRWVEVYPPSGTAGIALVPPRPGDPTAVQTGIILNTGDVAATHAQLHSQAVDVDAEVARPGAPARIRLGAVELAGPVPPMFWFRDPDGNSLLMVEAGA